MIGFGFNTAGLRDRNHLGSDNPGHTGNQKRRWHKKRRKMTPKSTKMIRSAEYSRLRIFFCIGALIGYGILYKSAVRTPVAYLFVALDGGYVLAATICRAVIAVAIAILVVWVIIEINILS